MCTILLALNNKHSAGCCRGHCPSSPLDPAIKILTIFTSPSNSRWTDTSRDVSSNITSLCTAHIYIILYFFSDAVSCMIRHANSQAKLIYSIYNNIEGRGEEKKRKEKNTI
jgi:hypothetical protein